jgi:hypothetical protein
VLTKDTEAHDQIQTAWKISKRRHLDEWQRPSSYGQSDGRNSKWVAIWIGWALALQFISRPPPPSPQRFQYADPMKEVLRGSRWRGSKLVKDGTKKRFFWRN